MFQTAFEVDGSQSGNVDFTMGTRFTFMDVAGFRSEWRTDVLLGNTYGIQTELFRPFRAESRWFFAPHADASDTAFQIYAKNDPLADYRIYRTNIGLDLGYTFGRFSELRVGYEIGSLNNQLRLGSPEIPVVQGPRRPDPHALPARPHRRSRHSPPRFQRRNKFPLVRSKPRRQERFFLPWT